MCVWMMYVHSDSESLFNISNIVLQKTVVCVFMYDQWWSHVGFLTFLYNIISQFHAHERSLQSLHLYLHVVAQISDQRQMSIHTSHTHHTKKEADPAQRGKDISVDVVSFKNIPTLCTPWWRIWGPHSTPEVLVFCLLWYHYRRYTVGA